MAKKKPKRVIDLNELRATEKIRYGRAVLTVERWVSVRATRIERALKAYRRNEATPDDVAWAFVKEQVFSHTPSFKWSDADLDRLLPRVIAVSSEPKLKARTPVELIPELEKIEKREREHWEKINKQMRALVAPKIPGLTSTIADAIRIQSQVPKLAISDTVRRNVLTANQQIAENLKTNTGYSAALAAAQPDLKILSGLRMDLEQISKTIRPQLPSLGIDIEKLGITGLGPGGEWQKTMERLADFAREEDAPEFADAAEATVNESEMEPFEVDLQALWERLKALLEDLAPDDSFRRKLAEAAITSGMIRFLEYLLTGN